MLREAASCHQHWSFLSATNLRKHEPFFPIHRHLCRYEPMSLYQLRDPAWLVFDRFSQSKPIWPSITPSTCRAVSPQLSRRHAEAQKRSPTLPGPKSGQLFQSLIRTYVIRQNLFEHLLPLDVAKVIHVTMAGPETGQKEKERHLHPMKYLFDSSELERMAKRIRGGYAIVLWGHDLERMFRMINASDPYEECPLAFKSDVPPDLLLRLAITDFAPRNLHSHFMSKPDLPGFVSHPSLPFSSVVKAKCPTPGIVLTHYKTTIEWTGDFTALPLVPWVVNHDKEGIRNYISPSPMGWSALMQYVNVHESPLRLRTSYGRQSLRQTLYPDVLSRSIGWGFEALLRGNNVFVKDMANLNIMSWNVCKPGTATG